MAWDLSARARVHAQVRTQFFSPTIVTSERTRGDTAYRYRYWIILILNFYSYLILLQV